MAEELAEVLIGIGSNIDSRRHIALALDALDNQFGPLTLSSVYQSAAIGFAGEDFLNLVAGFNCVLPLKHLHCWLRKLEADFGRRPDSTKFSSRAIDLDILCIDDAIGEFDGMVLPREEILSNAYVLRPLAELVPEQLHPLRQLSYRALWQAFDRGEQRIHSVDFDWRGKRLSRAETMGCELQ